MDGNQKSAQNHEPISNTGEIFYKKQLELANKEKAQLQERLHELERKNSYLLKSLFELSCQPLASASSKPMPMDIVQALKRLSTHIDPSPGLSGKGSAYRRSAPLERAITNPQPSAGVTPHISPHYNPFCNRADLIGHSAAVYVVQFSPNGQLLVSASFDKSIRFWSLHRFLDESTYDPVLSITDAHRGPVMGVEWTFDSARVLTGGLDQSAAEWDVEASTTNEPISRFLCNGLVNSVSVSPANDKLFFAGTSKNAVHLFDRRVPPLLQGEPWERSTIVMNDSVVNTIHVTLDGGRFMTGDHSGAIKTWDLRMIGSTKGNGGGQHIAGLVDTTYNDENRRPITHIHTSPPFVGEEYGRFMAVNSYDNFLRVYDRGSFLFKEERPRLKPLQAVRGVHNTNWPIKSSFFLGADYHPPRGRPLRPDRKREKLESAGKDATEANVQQEKEDEEKYASSYEDEDGASYSSSTDEEEHSDDNGATDSGNIETVGDAIQNTLILASGSADGSVYIFDVGGRPGTGSLLQTLEGHKDRVYAADFHPREPILASCSADASIKIWHSFR